MNHYYFALAGFFAASAAVVRLWPKCRKSSFYKMLLFFFSALLFWQLKMLMLATASAAPSGEFYLIWMVLEQPLFFIPAALLYMALYATNNRQHLWFFYTLLVVSIVLMLVTNLSSINEQSIRLWLIIEPDRAGGLAIYPGPLSTVMVFIYFLTMPIVLYLLFRTGRKQPIDFPYSYVNLALLLIVSGGVVSLLIQIGVELIDLSVLLVSSGTLLFSFAFPLPLRTAEHSGMVTYVRLLVLLSILTLIVALITLITKAPFHFFYTTILLILSAALLSLYLSRGNDKGANDKRSPIAVLQSNYNLTYNETIVCQYLLQGMEREEILVKMRISPATLKSHLNSIYKKTIDRNRSGTIHRQDKLQRLTIFINDL